MTDGRNLIIQCLKYISENNEKMVVKLLNVMKIPEINESASTTLLSRLLNTCHQYNADVASTILDLWDEYRSDGAGMSYKTKIFLMNSITDDTIRFLISKVPGMTYVINMEEINNLEEIQEISSAITRIDNIYIEQEKDVYETLLEFAKVKMYYSLQEFMEFKLKELTPYKEKPDYVYNFLGAKDVDISNYLFEFSLSVDHDLQDPLIADLGQDFNTILSGASILKIPKEEDLPLPQPEDDKFKGKLPSINTMIKKMLPFAVPNKVSEEQYKKLYDSMKSSMEKMTIEERRNIYNEYYKSINLIEKQKGRTDGILVDDPKLFRIYGPENMDTIRMYNNSFCTKFGCRMLTCNCFEGIDNETDYKDEKADWFTGNCSKCLLRLKSRAHAYRKPLIGGSWIGCYCSSKCVYDDMEIKDELVLRMMGVIDNTLNYYGLQDRISEIGTWPSNNQ